MIHMYLSWTRILRNIIEVMAFFMAFVMAGDNTIRQHVPSRWALSNTINYMSYIILYVNTFIIICIHVLYTEPTHRRRRRRRMKKCVSGIKLRHDGQIVADYSGCPLIPASPNSGKILLIPALFSRILAVRRATPYHLTLAGFPLSQQSIPYNGTISKGQVAG